ncbi:MAG: phospho-N-acetylmuramoyl-pentapeptide-transferase [Planctomycetota bacterium]
MLYMLIEWLKSAGEPSTLLSAWARIGFAMLTGFLFAALLGPRFIRTLTKMKLGEAAGEKDDAWLAGKHESKNGVPTMGGLLMMAAMSSAMLFWCRLDSVYTWLVLIIMTQLALIGSHDDWLKLNKHKISESSIKSRDGLRWGEKLRLQLIVGATVGLVLYYFGEPGLADRLFIPLLSPSVFAPALGVGFILFAVLVVAGSSNAVNLTDGLDGLAIGNSIIVLATFGLLAYLSGHPDWAAFMKIPHVPGVEELAVASSAMIGAGFGFLWFNAHPAQVFMGDTGSLAIGGLIATIALAVKLELLLIFVGGVFVWNTLTVILQVGWFKYTKRRFGVGRRMFPIAPFHHALQKWGWDEPKIVARFWIIGFVLAATGLFLLKL